jgi:hypothetical protein
MKTKTRKLAKIADLNKRQSIIEDFYLADYYARNPDKHPPEPICSPSRLSQTLMF